MTMTLLLCFIPSFHLPKRGKALLLLLNRKVSESPSPGTSRGDNMVEVEVVSSARHLHPVGRLGIGNLWESPIQPRLVALLRLGTTTSDQGIHYKPSTLPNTHGHDSLNRDTIGQPDESRGRTRTIHIEVV
ncbi:hypothetical protein BJX61DRAFT_526647, partial [Aspergillus egyptiacus]